MWVRQKSEPEKSSARRNYFSLSGPSPFSRIDSLVKACWQAMSEVCRGKIACKQAPTTEHQTMISTFEEKTIPTASLD
jgi:hypothetical protein